MNKWDYIKLKKILNSEGNHQHANATDWVGEDSWASGIWCVCVLVTQSCLTFCNPIAYQTTVLYEILQARILEWVAIPFSRGSSWPRDWTLVSCIVGTFFTVWATGEVPLFLYLTEILDGSEKSFRVRKIWVTFPVFCLFLIAGITLNKLLYFLILHFLIYQMGFCEKLNREVNDANSLASGTSLAHH